MNKTFPALPEWIIALAILALPFLTGCDQQVEQTAIVRTDIANASEETLWLTEAADCSAQPIKAGWYRDGLWIFRLSSTRGGVDVVTQELSVCTHDVATGAPLRLWHSVHGGGAPLIVLSCVTDASPCLMYQDGYAPAAWSGAP